LLNRESRSLIGLDIGSTSAKVVELSLGPSGLELIDVAWTTDGYDDSDLPTVHGLRSLLGNGASPGKGAATSVCGPSVAVRSFRFPELSPEEMDGAVRYEGDQVIAFDINDAYVDYSVLTRPDESLAQPDAEGPVANEDAAPTPDESDATDASDKANGGEEPDSESVATKKRPNEVLFVAATKEVVDAKTDLIRECGLEPRIVAVDALVLLDALFACADPPDTAAVLDVGARFSSLGIASQGSAPFVRDIEIAGNAFTEAIADARGVTFEEAEATKTSEDDWEPDVSAAVAAVTRRLISEISRSLTYYERREGGSKVDRMYVCGGGSRLRNLKESIASETGIEVQDWSPLGSVAVDYSRFDRALIGKLAPVVALAAALGMKGNGH
jgi:type IV pilus assembly protein PilM